MIKGIVPLLCLAGTSFDVMVFLRVIILLLRNALKTTVNNISLELLAFNFSMKWLWFLDSFFFKSSTKINNQLSDFRHICNTSFFLMYLSFPLCSQTDKAADFYRPAFTFTAFLTFITHDLKKLQLQTTRNRLSYSIKT